MKLISFERVINVYCNECDLAVDSGNDMADAREVAGWHRDRVHNGRTKVDHAATIREWGSRDAE